MDYCSVYRQLLCMFRVTFLGLGQGQGQMSDVMTVTEHRVP